MQAPVERVVLFPRYTAFAGGNAFQSAPMWARPYASAILAAWANQGLGGGNAVVFDVEQSSDLENWFLLGTVSPTPGTEASLEFQLQADWMRVRVSVAGADLGVTCWAVADMVPRHT